MPRGLVGELQAPLRIDDDDAFDHAGEDGFHPRAVARLFGQPAAEILHRVVERPRCRAQLVVAVAETRRRQVAAAVAPRDLGDRPHAAADPPRHEPREPRREGQREAERDERQVHHRLQLLADVGERQRHADERDRRMHDRHRDVEHVDAERRAVAPRPPQAALARIDHLGAAAVVLHAGDARQRLGRVADDDAVGADERDARAENRADPVGLGVELRDRDERRHPRQQLRREARVRDERRLDPRVRPAAHRLGEEQARDRQGDERGGNRRAEQLRAEGETRHGALRRAADRPACSRTA